MVTMSIPLDDELAKRLEELAKRTGKRAEELIKDVMVGLLDDEERYRAAVREGIAQADAGKLVDFDEAMERISSKLTRMKVGR